jgi:hypothetical protein
MEQTGWHVTIMAGGPTPNIDGNVMTYLLAELSIAPYLLKLTEEPIDHTQERRKKGINLTGTLAKSSMMDCCGILRCFFMRHSVSTLVATSYRNKLTEFLAEEDRAARSLVKCEPQDESENVELKGSTEEDLVDEDEDSDDDNYIEEGGNNVSTAKSANKGISEYAQRREKNIAELKTIIERVKAKYPMPEITKAQGRGKKRCVITIP